MITSASLSISDSLQEASDAFFAFLPNLLAFFVILIVGFIVGKVVKGIIAKLLEKVGVDKALHESSAGEYVEKVSPGASPAKAIGQVAFLFILAFFLFTAIGALDIPALTTFMNDVLAYLPNVIAAIAIFVLAAVVAGAVGGGVAKLMGDTPTGKIVASVVPGLILVIAGFMILEQLQIAPEIVRIAFAVTFGGLVLGLALAFGLGGREVAGRLLEEAYNKGQENKDQVKDDMKLAKERGEERKEQAKEKVEEEKSGSGEPTTSPEPVAYRDPAGGAPRA